MLVGGANLASHMFRAGLVDDLHLFVAPTAVGGGKPALPDGQRLRLGLIDERRFGSGMVFLGYRVTP